MGQRLRMLVGAGPSRRLNFFRRVCDSNPDKRGLSRIGLRKFAPHGFGRLREQFQEFVARDIRARPDTHREIGAIFGSLHEFRHAGS